MSDQALPVVRVRTDLDGGPIPRGRVSKRLEKAIRLIEEDGFTLSDAAQTVDMRTHSLTQALRKPHVKAFRAGVKRAWRESAAPKAWNRIVALGEDAASEKVQLEASKTVLTALGELAPEGEETAKAGALIQFIRQEIHHHAPEHPLRQRLAGVVEAEQFQDAEYEALDQSPGLTGGEGS